MHSPLQRTYNKEHTTRKERHYSNKSTYMTDSRTICRIVADRQQAEEDFHQLNPDSTGKGKAHMISTQAHLVP